MLTAEEERVVLILAEAWNAFLKLPVEHSDDCDEFRRAIHAGQDKGFVAAGSTRIEYAMTLMSQAEFAARRGVGKPAVSNWKKAGLLIFAEGADGKPKVDVERTEARLNARLDPMRGRPTSGTAPEPVEELDLVAAEPGRSRNLAQARAELVEEDLVGKRMANAVRAGELAPLVEMKRRLGEIGRMARERVAAEERNVAERLAATGDVRTIMAILDEARDRAFNALATAVERGALDDEDDGEPVAEAA